MSADLSIIIPIAIAGGLGFTGYLYWDVFRRETGNKKMREISDAIKEGAMAFMKRQYTTIAMLAIILAGILFGVYLANNDPEMGWKTAAGFLLGAFCSGLAGFIGMYVSVNANIRSAQGATKDLNTAMVIALRGGAVSGFAVVTMSLLGVAGLFYAYGGRPESALEIVGYGFGASFVALFAQLGGGIYTKAADVGADLVGKIEAGIPEDDPRNPAVIADLVGDNVGDCAGRGADLFESTAAENIGAMILGIALYPVFGLGGILFPLVARGLGLLSTILGIMIVKTDGKEDPMSALNRGYFLTTILSAILFGVAAYFMLNPVDPNIATTGYTPTQKGHPILDSNGHELVVYPKAETWMYFYGAGIIGMITSNIFVYITQYYTSYNYRPVLEIAKASQTGPGTNIITGFAMALECTAIPVITISVALLGAFWLGEQTGIYLGGIYGTAIATMGMLATCAYILAMDTFGPITDNAGGIIEMSQAPEEVHVVTDKLDSIGNTTKALTKGYAVGSAALAAFLLFQAYMEEAGIHEVNIAKPEVFIGGFIGAMLIFLFSSFAIRAVGKAAYTMIGEVRRQFKADPGIMAGTSKPDYAKCVDISTIGSLKEMVLPGVLAVATPIAVGVIFKLRNVGAEAEASLLMIGTITGILLALLLNNGGGAWDNAKKYIETGAMKDSEGNVIKKKSPTHAAAVVGDTVGDPFKDTAGPSLHVLIKLLSTITLVLAPLFV